MFVYVDDCLCVYHDLNPVMENLKWTYKLKGDSCREPDRYLGANVEKFQLNDGYSYWSMYAGDYLKELCKMVHKWSDAYGRKRNKNQKLIMIGTYQSEIDIY